MQKNDMRKVRNLTILKILTAKNYIALLALSALWRLESAKSAESAKQKYKFICIYQIKLVTLRAIFKSNTVHAAIIVRADVR